MCNTDLTPNLDSLVGRSICIEYGPWTSFQFSTWRLMLTINPAEHLATSISPR